MKFVTTENVHQEILSMHYILTYAFISGFKDLGIFSSSGLENPQLFYTYWKFQWKRFQGFYHTAD